MLELGAAVVALAPAQIRRIVAADSVKLPWIPLERALGFEGATECARVLLCEGPAGERAYGIPARARQCVAQPGTLIGLTAILRRFRPPPWLSGFVLQDGALALLVHLWHLETSPTRSSTPRIPHP